jgi:pimeloyl-ACP methyl ester carboxylesterase/DNA-binding CsgD family transcriptional regulator
MSGSPRVSKLIPAIRKAIEDPLSVENIERLWQADYSTDGADPNRIDAALDEALGAMAGETDDGRTHRDLARILDRFRHAALLVRSDGRIEAINIRGRRTIRADPGDRIDDIGYEPIPAEALSRRIGRFLNATRNAPHRAALWQVMARDTGRIATLAALRYGQSSPTALVFVIDAVWGGEAAAMARGSFGLSPAEAEILGAFMNGNSLGAIARTRGSAHATVRTQFHAVMTKFGARTQAELVRAAFGLSQFGADVEPLAEVARHPHRRRFHVLRPGGRSVEVFLAGDPQGAVVIYLAECTLEAFAAGVEARFHAAGLCVVSVSRPGYGATDPPPEGSDDLTCMAGDVEAVIGQLAAGPVVVAGHGTSAGFAFAFAAARPELASRVVVFAGIVPRPYIDEDLVLAPFAGALLRARDASPRLFRLIVRASVSAWQRLGTRRFNSLNLARSQADAAISRTAACVEEFDQALDAQLANGFARLEADLLLVTEDWSHHVNRCATPAILLHGAEDPVTSISSVRSFAAAHDNVAVREAPAAGYLLHHTEADLFVASLTQGLDMASL